MILDKIVREIEERLKTSNIKINITDSAREYFIENGYSEFYGARPLKRLVNHSLETILAKKIIDNEIKPGETITVDYINNKLEIN